MHPGIPRSRVYPGPWVYRARGYFRFTGCTTECFVISVLSRGKAFYREGKRLLSRKRFASRENASPSRGSAFPSLSALSLCRVHRHQIALGRPDRAACQTGTCNASARMCAGVTGPTVSRLGLRVLDFLLSSLVVPRGFMVLLGFRPVSGFAFLWDGFIRKSFTERSIIDLGPILNIALRGTGGKGRKDVRNLSLISLSDRISRSDRICDLSKSTNRGLGWAAASQRRATVGVLIQVPLRPGRGP